MPAPATVEARASVTPSSAAPAAGDLSSDATWAAWSRQLDAFQVEFDGLNARKGVTDAESDEVFARWRAVVDQIEASSAQSLLAARVKAKAILQCRGNDVSEIELSDQRCTDIRLAEALIRDLLMMGPV